MAMARAPWGEYEKDRFINLRNRNQHLTMRQIQERYYPHRTLEALRTMWKKWNRVSIVNTPTHAPDTIIETRSHKRQRLTDENFQPFSHRDVEVDDNNHDDDDLDSSGDCEAPGTDAFVELPRSTGTKALEPTQEQVPQPLSTLRSISLDNNRPAVTVIDHTETIFTLTERFMSDIRILMNQSPVQTPTQTQETSVRRESTRIAIELTRLASQAEYAKNKERDRANCAVDKLSRLKEEADGYREEIERLREKINRLDDENRSLRGENNTLSQDLQVMIQDPETIRAVFRRFSTDCV